MFIFEHSKLDSNICENNDLKVIMGQANKEDITCVYSSPKG